MKRPREGDLRASGEDRRLRGGQIRTRVRGGLGKQRGPGRAALGREVWLGSGSPETRPG